MHAREAFGEIDARHSPALGNEPEEERADRIADRGERAERQPVHEPHQGEQDPAHAGFGFAPFGVL